ncbi:MAG: sulfonate transport system substrate-binding protein [Alphaproteobacteria bacterium]|jgi:NitT/TauT family transport system substrate-binding protein|nr:sulfonate transport system substrate-binding protein [Alphaproteobacteria bacterium]
MHLMKCFGALALAAVVTAPAQGQTLEKKQITLGVGGKTALYYLPLTIAERLGHFKEQGLDVTINDFRGGAQSLQALVGGSVDVVTGAYEHTIRMQAKGQDVRAVIELGRFPAIVLGVRKARAAAYRSPADLKGMKIGVSAPGSSTNFLVWYLMAKAGLKPADASYIGVGIGPSAIAAITRGEIDALSNLDPMMTKLDMDGDIKVVADTRTEEGTRAVFGGSNPAAVLYVKQDFIARNPNTVQAMVNAFYKTLKWVEQATPDQIAATVPDEYWLGDKALYLAAVKASKPAYSLTGIIPAAGMKSANDMLVAFEEELKDAKVDLAKTFDDRFVRKAAAGR